MSMETLMFDRDVIDEGESFSLAIFFVHIGYAILAPSALAATYG